LTWYSCFCRLHFLPQSSSSSCSLCSSICLRLASSPQWKPQFRMLMRVWLTATFRSPNISVSLWFVSKLSSGSLFIFFRNNITYQWAGIAQWYSAGLRAGWSGVRVPAGAGNFFLHYRVQTGPPSLLSNGYQGLFPWGVKRQRHEADHLPSPSDEIKNAWSYTPTPSIRLYGVVLG
jgi:hypothetical protein